MARVCIGNADDAVPFVQHILHSARYELTGQFEVADDTAAAINQLLALMGNYAIGGKQVHDAGLWHTLPFNPQCQGF